MRKKPKSIDSTFFNSKRPWSQIKDDIIAKYLHPYLQAVVKLKKRIVIVDSFAGEGCFGPDKIPGSPVIICEALEKYAKTNCEAILVNRKRGHHEKLKQNIKEYITRGTATPVLSDAKTLLCDLSRTIKDETLLIYMDPFGITGCEFNVLEQFLTRNHKYSTELIINLNMPILHRYAAQESHKMIGFTSRFGNQRHRLLTQVLGGDYWKEILWDGTRSPEEKDKRLITAYINKLRVYLPYAGFCPVKERSDAQIKYYVTFCSRSKLSLLLMNEIMCNAYHSYMHQVDLADMPLFQDVAPHWTVARIEATTVQLKDLIISYLQKAPGLERKELWFNIVRDYFRMYRETEFNRTIGEMYHHGKIYTPSIHQNGSLNNNCKLFLS
jgi:three-Cys-motif partner protein